MGLVREASWQRVVSGAKDDRLEFPYVGRLAQLARAPRLHRGSRGFEPLIAQSQDPLSGAESVSSWEKVGGYSLPYGAECPALCGTCNHCLDGRLNAQQTLGFPRAAAALRREVHFWGAFLPTQ